MKTFTFENIDMNALKNTIVDKCIVVKITTQSSMEVQSWAPVTVFMECPSD